jgi:hypothetical protein
MDGIFLQYFAELFRLIRLLASKQPDESGAIDMLVSEDTTGDKPKGASRPCTRCDQVETLHQTSRDEVPVIGSSDSSVAFACAIRQRWLTWRRALSFYPSLAIAADIILVLQGTCASPPSAQNTPPSAVPKTANTRRLRCTKCGALRSP